MSRYRQKTETSKRGFIPKILDYQGDYVMDYVMDRSYVEYGTGCWVDMGSDPDVSYVAQQEVFQLLCGGVPDDHFVFNTCSDYRICFNPNCLATMEVPSYEPENG